MNKIDNDMNMPVLKLQKDLHKKYLLSMLNPTSIKYYVLDCSKLMILYFLVSSLDILDELENLFIPKNDIIDWIYSNQSYKINGGGGGFRNGPCLGIENNEEEGFSSDNSFDNGHLVHTYSALIILKTLKDDYKRLKTLNLVNYLKKCQNNDGSFRPEQTSLESDLRFLYSACVISHLINDWTGINKENALNFINNCRNSDGGYSLNPGLESHCGAIYCAIASLKLMNKLNDIDDKGRLIEWLVNRMIAFHPEREKGQIGGFMGRINKYPDSCYGFWAGASLKLLGFENFLNKDDISSYIFCCQNLTMGGFKKFDFSSHSDPIHTLHSLYALSILGSKDLKEIDPLLGIVLY